MSFNMTPASVQHPGMNMGSNSPVRRSERGPDSFGDAMSRSMDADRQHTKAPAAGTPSPRPAHRKDNTDAIESEATGARSGHAAEAASAPNADTASSSVREPEATNSSATPLDSAKVEASGKRKALAAQIISTSGGQQTASRPSPDGDITITCTDTTAGSEQIGHLSPASETGLFEAFSRQNLQTIDQKVKLKSDRAEDSGIFSANKMTAATGQDIASADATALSIAWGATWAAPTVDFAEANTNSANESLLVNTLSAPTAVGQATSEVASVTPAANYMLRAELGSYEWGKALSQQMIHLAGTAGRQTAELQLNPPGLGPLRVTLTMNDQQLQAVFISGHASVRSAVEAALPQLRTSLADNGINLGNTSVSSGDRQQAAFEQHKSRQPGHSTYQIASRIEVEAAASAPTIIRLRAGIAVDTYA